ncbi:MAG TPA: nicotinate-nicotinamide nucleotide adenylyltransferase [Candidatus Saccharimonadales bacterium]|nr:nicotinate-nicotinamide nucleotide adenylyltransferase [Candidatus Saccharimonadales bacterium]
MNTPLQVLVFGGSFDPPTLAHEAIIRACLDLPGFDEVWAMPSGTRADKSIATSDADRLAMLQTVHSTSFGGDPRLVVTDFELRLPRPTETRVTLRELAVRYPTTGFWLVMGGDSYRNLPNWVGANEYMHDLRLVVVTEEELSITDSDRMRQLHLPAPIQRVSSTEIRETVARGGDVSAWISPAVAEYIARHRLYDR